MLAGLVWRLSPAAGLSHRVRVAFVAAPLGDGGPRHCDTPQSIHSNKLCTTVLDHDSAMLSPIGSSLSRSWIDLRSLFSPPWADVWHPGVIFTPPISLQTFSAALHGSAIQCAGCLTRTDPCLVEAMVNGDYVSHKSPPSHAPRHSPWSSVHGEYVGRAHEYIRACAVMRGQD